MIVEESKLPKGLASGWTSVHDSFPKRFKDDDPVEVIIKQRLVGVEKSTKVRIQNAEFTFHPHIGFELSDYSTKWYISEWKPR